MANYLVAFPYMVVNEDSTLKGDVETDNDGGKVRYGLNSKAHPNLLTSGFYEESAANALLEAREHYKEWYWLPVHGDQITDQNVANKVFDQSVPMGIDECGKLAQRTLNVLSQWTSPLMEDGVIGPLTMNQLNKANPTDFLKEFKVICGHYYNTLVLQNPKYEKYLKGWLVRLNK